jgi:long-chain acyl-CoA synthetase
MKVVDGELWARGVSVSTGYYNDPENTAENFVDGWFRTGDMGYIDEDGFVFITGRKKNLIILGNGKNVAPEGIEEDIEKAIPYVSEVVVLGIDDKLCAAFYIDEESGATEEQLREDIAKFNKDTPVYKQITSVYVSADPFPRTTTKKIIRAKVEEFVMSKR